MELLHSHGAGLDVHKKTVVAHVRIAGPKGSVTRHSQTFFTMTDGLLLLSDWLTSLAVTHVALESTGEFWKPVYNLLEASFTVLVVNAQHMKNVPGRKTDVKDAEWIADLLCHGLVRGSFIPPQPQRDLRDLTRQRTNLVRDRSSVVNRLQKVLEWSNIKLASVASDVVGVSARAMLEAIVQGHTDATVLAELARGRLRAKQTELERALSGRVREHHRFLIAQHLLHIDFLDEQIAAFDGQITTLMQQHDTPPQPPAHSEQEDAQATSPGESEVVVSKSEPLSWQAAVAIWDSLPGIGRRIAEQLVAEIGPDMSAFPSAAHLASWAKLCPGNRESAGKRLSGRTGKGNQWLRVSLVQAAHAAVRKRDSWLAAYYGKLVARRGAKKAIVAVAHKLVTIGYSLLCNGELYQERGTTAMDERQKERLLARMQRRIEQLGYTVSLEPRVAAA